MGRPRLKRGDLVTAVFTGDYGKPRPCLVVQSDRLAKLDSVLLCPLTSALDTSGPSRVIVAPDNENRLVKTSLVMVDKVTALSRSRCRDRIGHVDRAVLERVDALLLLVLGLLD